jgi:hypothetical protein
MSDIWCFTRELEDRCGPSPFSGEVMQHASGFLSGRRITGHEVHSASRADRIEAQITRLTEITEKLTTLESLLAFSFNAGYASAQEHARSRTPVRDTRSTPGRKPVKSSHLRSV